MSEAKFQEEVLRSFRALGWYATHLSPPSCPGWEDVIALQYPYGLVLELKVFTEDDCTSKLKSLFTKAQRPRYIEQLEFGVKVIWVAMKHLDTGTILLFCIQGRDQVASMADIKIEEMFEASEHFASEEGMVRYLIRDVNLKAPF